MSYKVLTDHYTTFKFNGLKSYHINKDKNRNHALIKFIEFISTLDIEYRIKQADIAFDFFIENKSIENFLPVIKGASTSINNPSNTFETTLYVGNKNVVKPSVIAYIYDKSIKENLNDKIFRFEISIRDFNKIENNFEAVINHIKNRLSQYRLFYFDNKAHCNIIKREYRDNIPKKNKENFSKSLENKAFKLSANEFNLSLSDEIFAFINSIFTKSNKLVTVERKMPEWLKKIPSKNSLLRKLSKITTKTKVKKYDVKSEPFYINFNRKIYVLQLSKNIFKAPEITIIIIVFYPANKAPP